MRVVFMGTPEFAVPSLRAVHSAGFEVVGVATAPDRPQSRGLKVRPSPVKEAALELGIDQVLQPESVRDPDFADAVRALRPDVIAVVAFRILPPTVYETAPLGAFNLHGSLLPRYRGAAPIHRAVLNGDRVTGVTTFFLERKVDTGNVILRRVMTIGDEETTGEVYERMKILGAEAVVETLRQIETGEVTVEGQDESKATPAPKVSVADAVIDWSLAAEAVHNHIRGYSPSPGAWTTFEGNRVKVFRSRIGELDAVRGAPGTIHPVEDRLLVACRDGVVELTELQMEGRKKASGSSFLHGYRIQDGTRFGE